MKAKHEIHKDTFVTPMIERTFRDIAEVMVMTSIWIHYCIFTLIKWVFKFKSISNFEHSSFQIVVLALT